MTGAVLVTGGTGRIGTAFVHAMAARGEEVRVGTRSPQGLAAAVHAGFGSTVRPVRIDPSDPEGLDLAMQGVDRVLLVSPLQDLETWHRALGRACVRAGVRHVVKVSVQGARPASAESPPGPFPAAHYRGEAILRGMELATTMIRPTIFAQHVGMLSPALFSPGDDVLCLPIGQGTVAWLDARDIGICAAAILSTPSAMAQWDSAAFDLTGPRALPGAEVASVLSAVGGRPVEWDADPDRFARRTARRNAPDVFRHVYAEAADGWFSAVHPDAFESLVGRAPTSFHKFAYDHRHAFTARTSPN